MITAEMYKAAVGVEPVQDDLERSNCLKMGQFGHLCCGWDHKNNCPWFMSPDLAKKLNPNRYGLIAESE